ncbi:hypothetical protein ACP70R_042326 [Stipagrostis hirtigluma subsp. patula]
MALKQANYMFYPYISHKPENFSQLPRSESSSGPILVGSSERVTAGFAVGLPCFFLGLLGGMLLLKLVCLLLQDRAVAHANKIAGEHAEANEAVYNAEEKLWLLRNELANARLAPTTLSFYLNLLVVPARRRLLLSRVTVAAQVRCILEKEEVKKLATRKKLISTSSLKFLAAVAKFESPLPYYHGDHLSSVMEFHYVCFRYVCCSSVLPSTPMIPPS